jgi:serine/threonine protein kinase
MSRPDGCPQTAELRKLLDASPPAEDEVRLARHLDNCAVCRQALEALAAGDTPPANYRCLEGLDRPTQDEALSRAIGALKVGPSLSSPLPWQEAPLGFLSAPERPSCLQPAARSMPERPSCLQPAARSMPERPSCLQPAARSMHERPDCLGLIGPYRVTEILGRGGMGVVLKAFDEKLRRFVAIKVLAPHLAGSAAARLRFAREARAAAAVGHEHVVAVHSVDEAAGVPYLVMEYVAGVSLQEWLDHNGPPGLDVVVRIGMQVAQGLAAAHARGLIHRDIKPSNILLEAKAEGRRQNAEPESSLCFPSSLFLLPSAFQAKITDFGLARAADEAALTTSGVIAGTPPYMSPEQARGEAIDHRSDLFSLGSVLYALCTGRPPFQAEGTVGLLQRVGQAAPQPVQQVNPAVSDWLADLIALLHARDPAERLPSAALVADLLARYLAHLEQPALPPPVLPAPWRRSLWNRRRVLGGLGALLGIAGLGGALMPQGRALLTRLTVRAPRAVPARSERLARLRGSLGEDLDGLQGPVLSAAFSPGSEILATGGDDHIVHLWDVGTGRSRRSLVGHTERIWSVAFSPDGRLLASGSGEWGSAERGGEVRLWNVATGRSLPAPPRSAETILYVAFAPSGRTLAYAGLDCTVHLWNVDGDAREPLVGHRGLVRTLAFSPDGAILASGSFDQSVRLWDPVTGRQKDLLRPRLPEVNWLAFSPDGRLLAIACNRTGPLDGRRSAVPPTATPAPLPAVKPVAASGENAVELWEVETRSLLRVLRGHQGKVLSVAFSPDGGLLASGGGDWEHFGEVILWDVASGREEVTLHGHSTWVECVTFSPDGRTLASTGGAGPYPGEVRLWDVRSR